MSRFFRAPSALGLSLAGLVLGAWPVHPAQAAVNCTATMTGVNFGNVDLVAGVGLTASGTLNYSCTNTRNQTTTAYVCFNVGDGVEGSGNFNPRVMKDGSGNVLQFQLYQGPGFATVLGSEYNTSTPTPYVQNRSFGRGATVTGSLAVQGRLAGGQTHVPPGSYQDQFPGGHTAITVNEGGSSCNGMSAGTFPFTVQAAITKSCTVTAGTASDIQIGAASGEAFTATNLTGNNTIGVTCSKGTSYSIGLSPSNNNTGGAGAMAARNLAPVTGNADSVPYQLRSTPGMSGTSWGNTASNRVAGSGNGLVQSIPVYATVPNANFTPDSYADTVTVIVNY